MGMIHNWRSRVASRPRRYDELRRDVAATRARVRSTLGELKAHAPLHDTVRDTKEISRDLSEMLTGGLRRIVKRRRRVTLLAAAGVVGLVAAGMALRRH